MSIHTKEDFDRVIDKIKVLVERYENNVFHHNQYQLYLANGKRLFFEIQPCSIGHLLGIRLDYLRSIGIFKNKDAYLLLKEFLNNSNTIFCSIQQGHLTYNSLFSDFIEEKLISFEKNIYFFSPDEIAFVCKYDKSRTYSRGLEKKYPCDYFIGKIDDQQNLYFLGLIQNGNRCMPMSSLYFPNDDTIVSKVKGLLVNQVITYVNSVHIHNPITNFQNATYLSIPIKLKKMDILKRYSNLIDGVAIDVFYELQYLMNGYLMKNNKNDMYKMLYQQFKQSILEQESFPLEQFTNIEEEQVDSEFLELVQAYNSEVGKADVSKNPIDYNHLLENYRLLEAQVCTLNQQLAEQKEKSIEYYNQIKTLRQENIDYGKFQEEIFDIVGRQKMKYGRK